MGRDSEGVGLRVLPCRGVGSGLDTLGPVGQRLVSGFLHMEQLQCMPSTPCPLPPCPDTLSPAVLGPAKEAGHGCEAPALSCHQEPRGRRGAGLLPLDTPAMVGATLPVPQPPPHDFISFPLKYQEAR